MPEPTIEPPIDCPSCGRPTSGPDPYCDRCSGKRSDPPFISRMNLDPGRGMTTAVKVVIHLPQPADAMLRLLRLADELGATMDVTDPDGWTLTVPAHADQPDQIADREDGPPLGGSAPPGSHH